MFIKQRMDNTDINNNNNIMEAAIQGIANIMHENIRELRSEQDEVIDLFQKMVETTNKKILYMDEQTDALPRFNVDFSKRINYSVTNTNGRTEE